MLTTKSVQKAETTKKLVVGKVKEEPAVEQPAASDPEQAHSRHGPSSSDRWMNCLGSVLFTADMPDRASEYAAEGTAAHELSEWVRNEGKPAKHYIGREIEVEEWTFTVDTEMAAAVQRFCDYCEDLEGDAYYEERVHYTTWVPDGWGTADDIRISEDTCHVTDLKYGKGVQVWAKNNSQLCLYALGVFQDFHHLYDFKDFHLTIHQPRLGHVDEVWISVKELLIWARDEVKPKAEAGMLPNAPFAVGKWCQFCPANTPEIGCEERDRLMMEENIEDFEDLDDVDAIPGFKLGEIMDKLSMIRQWLSDVEAKAMSEVQQGHPVTGKDGNYKLVEGRSNRCWRSPEAAEKALKGNRKLKASDIYTKKLVGPAPIEKLLGKEHPIMKEHVEKPPGKPVLVPGSDPRPTLQVKAEDEFDDLDDDANATKE